MVGEPMETSTLNLNELFGMEDIRYVVPIFQRSYVWTKEKQWAPLWEDVLAVCTLIDEGQTQISPHFLGAVVLQDISRGLKNIRSYEIIDGQQRIITLQILLDAVQEVAEEYGETDCATKLEDYILNDARRIKVGQEHERFKVWPTLTDREPFYQAMSNDSSIDEHNKTNAIVEAHKFFKEKTREYANIDETDNSSNSEDSDAKETSEQQRDMLAQHVKAKLSTLSNALGYYLRLVAINLSPEDNAQVIFETLNYRGTPLLASDLIKNFLFQQSLNNEQIKIDLYEKYWKNFDAEWWQQEAGAGTNRAARIELYTYYWLMMKTRKEVSKDRVFTEFKKYYLHQAQKVETFLEGFVSDSNVYEKAVLGEPLGYPNIFWYRTVEVLRLNVVIPAFLWAMTQPKYVLSTEQRDKFLHIIEGWLMRRRLCGMPSSSLNKEIISILQKINEDKEHAGDIAEEHLLATSGTAGLWPTDDMVKDTLYSIPAYIKYSQPVIRCILEAIEDERRGKFSETSCPKDCSIEHLMPQSWEAEWESPVLPYTKETREKAVHSLGNLTLINGKLNSKLSNKSWLTTDDGEGSDQQGKRAELQGFSTIKITMDVVEKNPEVWNDETIEKRTEKMIGKILKIWSRPDVPLIVAYKTSKKKETKTFDIPSPEVKKEIELFLLEYLSDKRLKSFYEEYYTNNKVSLAELVEKGVIINSGVGSQYVNLIRTLYQGRPVRGKSIGSIYLRIIQDKILDVNDQLPFENQLSPEAREHLQNVVDAISLTFPSLVDENKGRHSSNPSKSDYDASPRDYYVNFGDNGISRSWDDGMKYGFITAGGGQKWSQPLDRIRKGDTVYVYIPGKGYVGKGTVTVEKTLAEEYLPAAFNTDINAPKVFLKALPLTAQDMFAEIPEDEKEYVVGVEWHSVVPADEGLYGRGLFSNSNIVCDITEDEYTKNAVAKHLGLDKTEED